MFDQKYLLQAVVVIYYLATSTQARHPASITRNSVLLNLNTDNVRIEYLIGFLHFSYDNDDVMITRSDDSNSVKFNIKNANLLVLQGTTRSPSRPKYDIGPKGVLFLVDGTGTAQLSPDGKHIENCQFVLAENGNWRGQTVEGAVTEILFTELPNQLSQELCKQINEYHFNKSNSLD